MKPSDMLETHRETIRRVVAAHHAVNPRLFGSVLHGTDREDSDLDILIDPTATMTMMDLGAIRHALMTETGLRMDVLTPNALPDHLRAHDLAEARPI